MMNYDEHVIRRLRRIEGQVRGAVDKAMAYLVATNLEKCIIDKQAKGEDTRNVVQEAVDLLIRSR